MLRPCSMKEMCVLAQAVDEFSEGLKMLINLAMCVTVCLYTQSVFILLTVGENSFTTQDRL